MSAVEPSLDLAFRFRALAEAMPQIVWTANTDGGLEFTNRRWHDYSGFTLQQSQGSGFVSF